MDERRSARRRAEDEDIHRRLEGLEGRMHEVESSVMRLSIGIERSNEQTKEMYETFQIAQGGFRFLGYLGSAIDWVWSKAKPIFWMLSLGSATLYYLKGGDFKWPSW